MMATLWMPTAYTKSKHRKKMLFTLPKNKLPPDFSIARRTTEKILMKFVLLIFENKGDG